jgi:hypothetical protein
MLLDKEMTEKRVLVLPDKETKVNKTLNLNIMVPTIENVLHEAGNNKVCNLWVLHQESINQHFENSGKSRHTPVPVHPIRMSWSIAFLAKTPRSIYQEVAKVMLLPESATYIKRPKS